MSTLLPLLKFTSIGGAVIVGSAVGGAGFYYRKEVTSFFENLVGSNTDIEGSQLVYAVVKYTAPTTDNEETKRLIDGQYGQFKCRIEGSEVEESSCVFYKFPTSSSTSMTVNLESIRDKANEALTQVDLSDNKNFLVKLSRDFYRNLNSLNKKEFKIVDTSGNNVDLGSLELLGGLAIEDEQKRVSIQSSSIFILKLSEQTSTDAGVAQNESLVCKFGSANVGTPCKAYKLTDTTKPYERGNLANLSAVLTKEDLSKDKYLLIDLLGTSKSIQDLENQIVLSNTTKTSDKQDVAKGLIEQILIGSVDEVTPTNSELLIVENANSSLTTVEFDKTPKTYILTKGGEAHHFLKSENYSKDQYLCRVIVGSVKYDDDSCELYAFDKESSSIDITKLTADTQISDVSKLGVDTYQIVKVAKTLQDKLGTLTGKEKGIEIIKKDRATSAWNHRLVSLTHLSDLLPGSKNKKNLASDMFLVRATWQLTDEMISLQHNTQLKCTIKGTNAQIGCKFYKFAQPKTTNGLTSGEIATLSDSFRVDEDVKVGQYYVVALTGQKKSIDELKNKEIVVSVGQITKELAKFTFDQLLFGKAKTIGSLGIRDDHIYMVEKSGATTDWASEDLPASYRCKLPASSDKVENFDDECQLTKISPTDTTHKLISSADLKKNPETQPTSTWKLKDDADGFYRLKVDLNRLYNLDPEGFINSPVVIEIVSSTGTAKTFGKLKLLQDITDESAKGEASLILGKVSGDVSANSLLNGECNFVSTTETTAVVNCTAYKSSGNESDADIKKATFTEPVSSTDTFTTGKHVLIKLTTPQSIDVLKSKRNIYYKQSNATTPVVTMSNQGILGGDVASGKKLYFLNEPNTPSQG